MNLSELYGFMEATMRLAKSGVAAMALVLASVAFLAAGGPASAQQQMGQNMMGPGNVGPGMMNQGPMGGAQGCPGMMGQGNMGQGNMGQGNMGQGMMGGGMMGPGMMGPMMGMMHQDGMMGPGMMNGGMMNGGMMGMMHDDDMRPGMMGGGMMNGAAGFVMLPAPAQLGAADVTYNLERMLAARGNPHLKVGKVEDKDADTIVGEVVTTEGSLVERYEVDKRSGLARLVP